MCAICLPRFLSTLLFDTYSLAEANMLVENLLQCRRNHRIKHIVVGEICSLHNRSRRHKFVDWLCYLNIFDPVQCHLRICFFLTNFRLEVDFPALKFQWVREFPTMHFRDWKSRVIHHTIARISSSNMIYGVQGCNALIQTRSWYCRTLRLSSHSSSMFHNISCITWSQSALAFLLFQTMMPNSLNFRREPKVVLLDQAVVQKTFPEVPIVFRLSSGNPESRLRISLALGIINDWLGTWVAPELLPDSGSWNSVASDKEFTLFCDSWIWVIIWLTVVGFLCCCTDNSSLLACLAPSVSSQQILVISSFFWQ